MRDKNYKPRSQNRRRYPDRPPKRQSGPARHYSSGGKGAYVCEICGNNIYTSSSVPPFCPRCNIPMQPSKSGNRKPGSRNTGRRTPQGFNYAPRIYHQTDGHPQYVGLPLEHPDPEDEDAVRAYQAQRDSRKQQRRTSGQRHSRPRPNPGKRTDYQHSSQPRRPQQDQRPHDHKRHLAKPPVESKQKRAPAPAKPPETKTPPLRRKPEKKSPVAKQMNPGEYTGTALTEVKSTATMVNESFAKVSESSIAKPAPQPAPEPAPQPAPASVPQPAPVLPGIDSEKVKKISRPRKSTATKRKKSTAATKKQPAKTKE